MKFFEELFKQFKSTNNLNLFLEMCKLSYKIEFAGIMNRANDCYFPEYNSLHTVIINFAKRFGIQIEGFCIIGGTDIYANFAKGKRQLWVAINRETGTVDETKSVFGEAKND